MDSKSASYQSLMPEKPKEDMSSMLISPMPGTVVSISVEVGDAVTAGQSVAVVEAMKMQNGMLYRIKLAVDLTFPLRSRHFTRWHRQGHSCRRW